MKPEISYKLKIIGAKKLPAKTSGVRGSMGKSLLMLLLLVTTFLNKMCGKSRLVYTGLRSFLWNCLGKTLEYLHERNPVIMGTQKNDGRG